MKYYLFIGAFYYPRGGVYDFVESSTSLEELQRLAKQKLADDKWRGSDWYHICDEDMNIVDKSNEQGYGN